MAITRLTYQLLKEHRSVLKHGGSLMELGEANWYGDETPAVILSDATEYHRQNICYVNMLAKWEPGTPLDLFMAAKAAYSVIFQPSQFDAIDFHGTERAKKLDLNRKLFLRTRYDVVINNGTLEHVFDLRQSLENMHNLTATGGIMIHDSPFTGWVDHGFYTFQPTLFYDLAHANDYDLISLTILEIQSGQVIRIESREAFHRLAEIPENAQLFVVLRKTSSDPFRVPMQGLYDGQLSQAGVQAWHGRR